MPPWFAPYFLQTDFALRWLLAQPLAASLLRTDTTSATDRFVEPACTDRTGGSASVPCGGEFLRVRQEFSLQPELEVLVLSTQSK